MKLLIIDRNFHAKNKDGMQRIIKYLKLDALWVAGPVDFGPFDVIYSPGMPLSGLEKWKDKRFIFGPHLGVYPSVLQTINSITGCDNAAYIQPSEWVRELFAPALRMPVHAFPFPIDTCKFDPHDRKNPIDSNKVILYFKMRNPELLTISKNALVSRGFDVLIFNYETKYKESDYISALQTSRFVFWLGCHESQGFALGEALSMNVPAFVWNVQYLSDQWGGGRPHLPATALSYWDDSCGDSFTSAEQLESGLDKFLERLSAGAYQPRSFIVDNLGIDACSNRFKTGFLGESL